jgi:hypothetical protein
MSYMFEYPEYQVGFPSHLGAPRRASLPGAAPYFSLPRLSAVSGCPSLRLSPSDPSATRLASRHYRVCDSPFPGRRAAAAPGHRGLSPCLAPDAGHRVAGPSHPVPREAAPAPVPKPRPKPKAIAVFALPP